MAELIYNLIRSRRRSIALMITQEATVEVRAPLRASLRSIKEFVNKNRSWIEKKKDFVNKHRHYNLPKEFVDGANVTYEGDAYRLQISDCEDIKLSDILSFPKKFLPNAKEHLTVWLKNRAREKIFERVGYFAKITRLQYRVLKITSAKGIWGSCSSKGSLNINWRLIMAPSDVLDYIVVHELTHLVEKNHSQLFWQRVKNVLPGYEQQEEWLKNNGEILML